MTVPELSAKELRARLARGDELVLLDVRQPWEFALGHIQGARLLPLSDLPERLDELDREAEIVTICAVGQRSAHAAQFLLERGFRRVINLHGGMWGWAVRRVWP